MSGAGATGNSIPARKIDETELQRLQAKDRWLQITRAKLVMDLIFVCKLGRSHDEAPVLMFPF